MTLTRPASDVILRSLPDDYAERVYAGVLGKIIGVYLGRPIEDWRYDRIMSELGEVWYYVSDRLGQRLVTTDDDITGTFTFMRAIEDHGDDPAVTPQQIAGAWLDYLIDGRTVLWWSGMGNSTEHTAYLRLKAGIPAPESGSARLNGQVVAEQIGGQIFIDGWAMLHPGDPEQAADIARRAASVSHDGAAIHAAQVIAAMEAQAFIEPDIGQLLDTGMSVIPADSIIRRVVDELREQRAEHNDWRRARIWLDENYGYGKYGGNVHVVPNHGLIVLSMLFGDDDFTKSLMIVNTSGWDTDCNSGNLGCLMGIKNGLAGIDGEPDWRGPVADRMYLPTADGGRAITDAVRETDLLVATARRMRGMADERPKDGARFHFSQPGSVQAFQADSGSGVAEAQIDNISARAGEGEGALRISWTDLDDATVVRALTPTFVPEPSVDMGTYELLASPTLYPGQTVRARLRTDSQVDAPITVAIALRHYGGDDSHEIVRGPSQRLEPGSERELEWQIPDLGGQPVSGIGLEITEGPRAGSVILDRMGWSGSPQVKLSRPAGDGTMWRRAWVDAVDHWATYFPETYRIMQDSGVGLLSQGTDEWIDYEALSSVRLHMGRAGGLAVRVRGRRRWYGLLMLADGSAQLVRSDGEQRVLAEVDLGLNPTEPHLLGITVRGDRVTASIDGTEALNAIDPEPLGGGGVALVVEEGRLESNWVEIRSLTP